MIRFEIPGPPVAKARPKFVRAKKFVRAVTPKKTVDFENRVRFAAEAAGVTPIEGAVVLVATFLFAMPKSRHRKREPRPAEPKTTKPDVDNCLKAVVTLKPLQEEP